MTESVCRALVAAAAHLVPAIDRPRWRLEWDAEIAYAWQHPHRGPLTLRRRLELTRRASSAVAHAGWMRKDTLAMNGLRQDLALAVRFTVRQPSFVARAALMLALGIGANTAIFSVVSHTLLTPLPFADPDRLATVWETVPSQDISENTPAPSTLERWRNGAHEASAFAAYTTATVNLTGDGDPERMPALRTSANLLAVLGIQPIVGRPFTAGEDAFGGPRAVLLTDQLWTRRFHRDPAILGRSIVLNGDAATVVGVLPSDVPLTVREFSLWMPLALTPSENPDSRMLFVLARLRPGAAPAGLQSELDRVMHPPNGTAFSGIGVNVQPIDQELRGGVRPDLTMIFAVSAIVLVIACSNVAIMLLARGVGRRRELAVRASLGASRLRLIQLLSVESAVIGVLGVACGLLLGALVVRVIEAILPASLASTVAAGIDGRMLVFAIGLGLVSSVLFGVAPVIGASGRALVAATRGRERDDERPVIGRLRSSLVVLELALAVILLAAASVLAQSFTTLVMTPTGFVSRNALTAQVFRADSDDDRRTAFYERLVDSLAAVPGVQAVGLTNGVPLRFTGGGSGFQIQRGPSEPFLSAHHRIVSAGYFDAMGIAILRGATFGPGAQLGREPVAIVSESFAAAAWGSSLAAVGQRVRWGGDGPWMRVVGVAGDIRLARTLPIEPHVYLPFTQVESATYPPTDLVIRSSLSASSLTTSLRDVVRRLDPNQPLSGVTTMDDLLARSVGRRRFTLTLMAAFAALALLLSLIGIHGVLSYVVHQRRQEIGVRLAIGASPWQVRRHVLARGLGLTVIGIALGAMAAAMLSRWAGAIVPGLSTPILAPMIGAIALLAAAAIAACDAPARRAMRVDPILALRAD